MPVVFWISCILMSAIRLNQQQLCTSVHLGKYPETWQNMLSSNSGHQPVRIRRLDQLHEVPGCLLRILFGDTFNDILSFWLITSDQVDVHDQDFSQLTKELAYFIFLKNFKDVFWWFFSAEELAITCVWYPMELQNSCGLTAPVPACLKLATSDSVPSRMQVKRQWKSSLEQPGFPRTWHTFLLVSEPCSTCNCIVCTCRILSFYHVRIPLSKKRTMAQILLRSPKRIEMDWTTHHTFQTFP